MVLELKLHSPAAAEPAVYQWPLQASVGVLLCWRKIEKQKSDWASPVFVYY